MSSISKSQKRKNKKKYYNSSKKSKSSGLEPGMKGFLVTCNDERRCVQETYNLLNEFADEIYGPEFEETVNNCEESYVDIDEQFAKEVAAIKSKSQRRFQQMFTKVKGVLFINTTIPDPVSLVNKIFETVINTGKRRTRFVLKLKPVVMTCKIYESDIRKALDDILLQYSAEAKDKELKYKVDSKIRHNDKITSSHLIWYVRDSVKSIVPKWSACILEPDIIISFYILRTVCCISILDKYEDYKKYNLSNVVTPVEGVQVTPVSEKDGQITRMTADNTNEIKSEHGTEKQSENSVEIKSEPHNENLSENSIEIKSKYDNEGHSENLVEHDDEKQPKNSNEENC